MTSHSAGVFAADESAQGDLAAALGAAGYAIASRLTLDSAPSVADSPNAFEQWLDRSIEDEGIHVVVGTATDATRAATLVRITKRVPGFAEIPGIDGGRCKNTIVILVPDDAEARAAAIAFALPHVERELAGESPDAEPHTVVVSIPDLPPASAKPKRLKEISGVGKIPPVETVDKEPSVVAKIPPVEPVDKPPVDKPPSVLAKIPLVSRAIPATPTPTPKPAAIPAIPSTPPPKPAAIPAIPSTPPPKAAAIPAIPSTPMPKPPATKADSSGSLAKPPAPSSNSSGSLPKPPVTKADSSGSLPKPPAPIPATPPPVPGVPAGRKTPPPPPLIVPHRLATEEIEPLSLDDMPEAAAAPPAIKKTDDAIGRLFEKTPAPSELTPIAAKAVAAADKAKAEAAEKKPAAPELVVPETFSMSTEAASVSPASRSRRNLVIAGVVGVAVVAGAAALLLGHASKSAAPKVAQASPKTPSAAPPEVAADPAPAPAPDQPAGAPSGDQPGSAVEQPTIDLPDDHVAPSAKPAGTPHVAATTPPTTAPVTPTPKPSGSAPAAASAAAAGSAAKPGATVEAPVSADGCDKVSCVIDAYARPCCEPFRPRKPGETPRELDRNMILAGMATAKAAVIHCGEATPSAKGIVRLAMKVAPDGSVADASVAETPDPALGDCVAAAIRKVTFAATEQGGTFNYPFKF